MNKTTKISAKDLGALAMPDFCERCFWIKRNVKNLPWQIFPGIFSSIDSYTKKVIHYYFETTGAAPTWIPEFKEAKTFAAVPHWSKFFRTDPKTGIIVSGMPDDMLLCEDDSFIIPDYKTAKHTANADKLFPMYEAQLNGYAWIAEGTGRVVKSIPLVYFEPLTGQEDVLPGIYSLNGQPFGLPGFLMGFKATVVPVENRRPDLIRELLDKAKAILDLVEPPAGADGCKDCQSLDGIMQLMKEVA